MNKLMQRSLLNALGTVAYVALITTVMSRGEEIFGNGNKQLGSIAFLMLFVISAAITGGLVVGKPMLMYLGGEKTDAVKLFMYTIGWLAVAVVLLMIIARVV